MILLVDHQIKQQKKINPTASYIHKQVLKLIDWITALFNSRMCSNKIKATSLFALILMVIKFNFVDFFILLN